MSPHDPLEKLRGRIAESIGGRRAALAFSLQTAGRFSRKTLQSWIDGKTSPDVAELVALSEATHKPLGYFIGSEAQPVRAILEIPVMNVQVAAGDGTSADVVEAVDSLPFPKVWAAKLAPPGAELSCLRVQGDSMEPTILHGALLILDQRQKTPRPYAAPPKKSRPKFQEDEIFVFWHGGDLRLKRLRDLGEGDFAIISDNVNIYGIEIHKSHNTKSLKVVGKVIWWDNRL